LSPRERQVMDSSSRGCSARGSAASSASARSPWRRPRPGHDEDAGRLVGRTGPNEPGAGRALRRRRVADRL